MPTVSTTTTGDEVVAADQTHHLPSVMSRMTPRIGMECPSRTSDYSSDPNHVRRRSPSYHTIVLDPGIAYICVIVRKIRCRRKFTQKNDLRNRKIQAPPTRLILLCTCIARSLAGALAVASPLCTRIQYPGDSRRNVSGFVDEAAIQMNNGRVPLEEKNPGNFLRIG